MKKLGVLMVLAFAAAAGFFVIACIIEERFSIRALPFVILVSVIVFVCIVIAGIKKEVDYMIYNQYHNNQYDADEIEERVNALMANEEVKKARGNMSNSMVEYEVGLAIQDFRNQFNCEPQQTAEDLKWLVERAIKHLSSPTNNKVYAPEKAKK